MNWTQLICEGRAPLFTDRPCENYSDPPPECELLRKKAIALLCKSRRCTFAMIGFAQKKLSKAFDHLDDREDIDLKKLMKRLRRVVWKDSSHPAGWLMFVKKVVQRATVRALARQRMMPEEMICGTCAHLSDWHPRVCQKDGKRRNARDRSCDEYQFLPATIAVGSLHGWNPTDDKSEADFASSAIQRSEDVQRGVEARMDVERLRRELAKRAENERQGTRRRTIFARQYELFVNLHHLMGEGLSNERAFRLLSIQMGVSPRALRRDLAQIREFFRIRFF